MKIVIFGNSGSGKSTFARAISDRHKLPHLDLDTVVWEPGEIAVQRPAADIKASLDEFISSNSTWVIEGCYGELVQAASLHCTKLLFLNPGIESCLANNLQRPWEPHKYASIDEQNKMLPALQAWVAGYYERDDSWSYKSHRAVFDAFSGVKVEHLESPGYAV